MSAQKYEFKSKVLEKKPCSISMEVEIEPSQTDIELKLVYESIQQTAKIPGFRTGKVPMDMVTFTFSLLAKVKSWISSITDIPSITPICVITPEKSALIPCNAVS